jgi:hypothetical protein
MSHSGSSQNFSVTGRQPGSRQFDGPEDKDDEGNAGWASKRGGGGGGGGVRKVNSAGSGSGSGSMGRLAQLGASNLKLGQDFSPDELFSEDPVHDLTASFALKLPSRAKMSHVSHSPSGSGGSAGGFRSSLAASKGGDDVIGGSGGGPGGVDSAIGMRAAKGYHIKTSKNTWETVGQMKSPLERPITRKEVEALDARFAAAMAHIEDSSGGGGGIGGGGIGGEGGAMGVREVNPVFEQDLMQIRSEIGALYSSLEEKHVEQERTMARCLFKQKWTDLVFGELSDQLNVTCLEQGVLLHKIRVQFASICEEFRQCHDSGVAELKEHERLMRNLRVQLADIKQASVGGQFFACCRACLLALKARGRRTNVPARVPLAARCGGSSCQEQQRRRQQHHLRRNHLQQQQSQHQPPLVPYDHHHHHHQRHPPPPTYPSSALVFSIRNTSIWS